MYNCDCVKSLARQGSQPDRGYFQQNTVLYRTFEKKGYLLGNYDALDFSGSFVELEGDNIRWN